MTMDQLYLPITALMLLAVVVRLRVAVRDPFARASWLATLFAVPALLTRGGLVPIDVLDKWIGGENLIFLVQCWFATLAFWALTAAAGTDRESEPEPLNVKVPLGWCAVYTVTFFLIPDRAPTELFFIDAHVDSLAAIACGVLYMAGIVVPNARLLNRLRRRESSALWVLRIGAALVIAGCLLWTVAICLDHVLDLHRDPIRWMYIGFDVTFYPGVILLSLGMLIFAARRQLMLRTARRFRRQLQQIFSGRGIPLEYEGRESSTPGVVDLPVDIAHDVVDLLVAISDNPALDLTRDEDVLAHHARQWIHKIIPDLAEPVLQRLKVNG